MEGEKRRENILRILQDSDKPVSGTRLAEKFQISRQVVVQDIALLRAKKYNIISEAQKVPAPDFSYPQGFHTAWPASLDFQHFPRVP